MKITAAIFLFIIIQVTGSGQILADSAVFDNTFRFKDGIYTSLIELKYNSPKYPGCTFHLNDKSEKISTDNLYYTGSQNVQHKFDDYLFAMVTEGSLYIFHHNYFCPVFLRGAICTFILKELVATTNYTPATSYGNPVYGSPAPAPTPITTYSTEVNIYFMDFQLGIIEKVSRDNLEPFIKRDSILYQSFKKIKGDPKNKKSYPFISQYNIRNPMYILLFKEETEE